jgi:hypothetical protein
VAYTWSGRVVAPTDADMRGAIAAYRARRGQSQKTGMRRWRRPSRPPPESSPTRTPTVRRARLVRSVAPSQYRLSDVLPDAAERFAATRRRLRDHGPGVHRARARYLALLDEATSD